MKKRKKNWFRKCSFFCTLPLLNFLPECLELSFPTDIDAPTNLATREVTENSATVTWDGVRAEIDGYMLTYSSAEGTSREIKVAADATSYQLTSLKPGVLYTFFLWAYKGSRSSRKSMTKAETGKLFAFCVRMWGFTLTVFISSRDLATMLWSLELRSEWNIGILLCSLFSCAPKQSFPYLILFLLIEILSLQQGFCMHSLKKTSTFVHLADLAFGRFGMVCILCYLWIRP